MARDGGLNKKNGRGSLRKGARRRGMLISPPCDHTWMDQITSHAYEPVCTRDRGIKILRLWHKVSVSQLYPSISGSRATIHLPAPVAEPSDGGISFALPSPFSWLSTALPARRQMVRLTTRRCRRGIYDPRSRVVRTDPGLRAMINRGRIETTTAVASSVAVS
jgi:hypothetical protein